MLGHTQLTPHTAHFVLKQPLQRLTKLQMHLLGQTANIMMAFDDLTSNVQRLNSVGIDSALSKPFGIGNLLGFGIEHFHEITTDNLTFLFWIGDTCQVGKEFLRGIDSYHIQA